MIFDENMVFQRTERQHHNWHCFRSWLIEHHIWLIITKPKQHSTNNISNVTKSKIASFSKQQSGKSSNQSSHESSLIEDDYKFIERFNRDMMDQFMEHQRRTQV